MLGPMDEAGESIGASFLRGAYEAEEPSIVLIPCACVVGSLALRSGVVVRLLKEMGFPPLQR